VGREIGKRFEVGRSNTAYERFWAALASSPARPILFCREIKRLAHAQRRAEWLSKRKGNDQTGRCPVSGWVVERKNHVDVNLGEV